MVKDVYYSTIKCQTAFKNVVSMLIKDEDITSYQLFLKQDLVLVKQSTCFHRRTGNFRPGGAGGGAVNHLICPLKNSCKLPKFLQNSPKKKAIRCNNIGRTGT